MTRGAGAVLLLLLGVAPPARAQWRLGPEVRVEWFAGVSREASGDRRLVPYRPVLWGVRVEAPGRRVGAALTLRHGAADLALTGPDLTVVSHDAGVSVTAVVPSVRYRPGTGPRPVPWAEAGVALERWTLRGGGSVWRPGGVVGGGLAVPLGRVSALQVGATLAYTPGSPLADWLPPDLRPRGAWRAGLGAGVLLGW